MDDARFDALALRLGALWTRRRAAAALAALGLGLGAEAGAKKKKKKCKPRCAGKACGASDGCTGTCNQGSCPPGQTCDGGTCQPGEPGCGAGGPCRVFATSTLYNGNHGGLSGADSRCNARAQAAGLPGTYKAWLSDSTGSPSTRFVQSTSRYELVTGTKVADDWDDLTDDDPEHRLDQAIDRNEFGAEIAVDGFRFAWTNTKQDGTINIADYHCQNWLTSDGVPNRGGVGDTSKTDSLWTNATDSFCNNPSFRLYCFQQS